MSALSKRQFVKAVMIIFGVTLLFIVVYFVLSSLEKSEALAEKRYNGHVYYLPEYMQFIDKYSFAKMVGQACPAKYANIPEKLPQTEIDKINGMLEKFWGQDFNVIDKSGDISPTKLQRTAIRHSRKRYGIKHFQQRFLFVFWSIINFISPKGLFLSFTGPDGVGKTTVLNIISDTYQKVWSGNATKIYHFRPDALPRLAVLMHRAGAVQTVDEEYSKPHRGKSSGKLGSMLRLLYYMVDYQIGYWSSIHLRRFRRQVTIFDRYYTDIVADSERSNIKLPYRLIYELGRFIPQPTYPILITARKDIILSRKQELADYEIDRIQMIIDWLTHKNKRYIHIENNGTAERAAVGIMDEILARQDGKNRKYFRR